MRMSGVSLLVFSLAGSISSAQQHSPLYDPKTEPPGAGLLCVWRHTQAIQVYGERCATDESLELKEELTEIIAKYDNFILENLPTTRDKIEREKAVGRELIISQPNLCKNADLAAMYRVVREYGGRALRDAIAKWSPRPGKPTFDPCV